MEVSAKNSDRIFEAMETMTRMMIKQKMKKGILPNSNYDTPVDQGRISLNDYKDKEETDNQECCNFPSIF